MKKLQVLVAALVVIVFTGCSDDDGASQLNHSNIEQSILGKWFPQGGTINGGEFEAYNGDDCEEFGDYQEFLASGEVKFVGYNDACEVDETNTSQYTISGNVLTVSSDIFSDMVFTIESITSQQLVLKSTYNTPDGQWSETAYFSRQ